MDKTGSGLFRIKRRLSEHVTDHLIFLSQEPIPDNCENYETSKPSKSVKSSIYMLSNVYNASGTISVKRTDMSLSDWLAELSKRRGITEII